MKKILALILAMLLMLGTFVACNNSKEETDAPSDEQTEAEETPEGESDSESESESENESGDSEECAHVDEDKNHSCDKCEAAVGEHVDPENDGDHLCDYCGDKIGSCIDDNSDGKCDVCGATVGHIHKFEKNTCTFCGFYKNGGTIKFGSYPQSEVTDTTLMATLYSKSGPIPTGTNSQNWTSYGYYISNEVSNFMWYTDVELGGEKYRGVYFSSYRPTGIGEESSTDKSYQDDRGYTTNTVYWFKYEPISWTILDEDLANGTALILCDLIIDSQAYQNEYEHQIDTDEYWNASTEEATYANNYEYSTIRKWLNETFYKTAFSELQQQMILTTAVDNGAETIKDANNKFESENTEDKVFLLSYQDLINTNYDFSPDALTTDAERCKTSTDYARSQGTAVSTSATYAGNGWWFLRSPSDRSVVVSGINQTGAIQDYGIHNTAVGVVPALKIKM